MRRSRRRAGRRGRRLARCPACNAAVHLERTEDRLDKGRVREALHRRRHDRAVARRELAIRAARRVARLHQLERLHHPRAAQLHQHVRAVERVVRDARLLLMHRIKCGAHASVLVQRLHLRHVGRRHRRLLALGARPPFFAAAEAKCDAADARRAAARELAAGRRRRRRRRRPPPPPPSCSPAGGRGKRGSDEGVLRVGEGELAVDGERVGVLVDEAARVAGRAPQSARRRRPRAP